MKLLRLLPTLLVLLAVPALAGVNRWTPIGPPGAFQIERLHFDAADPSTVYAETRQSGLWRSRDGGASWASLGVSFLTVAADPRTPGLLYAVAIQGVVPAVWRSEDFGATWEKAFVGTGVDFDGRSSRIFFTPDALYWLSGGDVFRSTDGGLTFQCFQADTNVCTSPSGMLFEAFAIDPADPQTLYGTANGFFSRSDDGGTTWSEPIVLPASASSHFPYDRLLAAPGPLLYAWTSYRQDHAACFARSDDRGVTWKMLLPERPCGEPLIDPAEPRTVRVLVGPENRLWTSRDAGDTWEQGAPAPIQGLLFASPAAPRRLYLAGREGVFRSDNGGATWAAASHGLQASSVRLLESSPEARGVLYAAVAPVELEPGTVWNLQKTLDAGRTWRALPLENPVALAIDPADPEHLFAATLHVVPGLHATSRVFESHNGGRSWTDILERQLPRLATDYSHVPPQATLLAVDPRDSRTLYLGTILSGLLKSTDGGRTWQAANRGLDIPRRCDSHFCPANRVTDLVVDPFDPRVLYLIFESRVYRSEDGGETWRRAGRGVKESGFGALAADPARPGTLWAVAGSGFDTPFAPGGVYRSRDGGRSWAPAGGKTRLPGLPILTDIAVTPAGVFVATRDQGVLRSRDGGRTWARIQAGLPNPFVTRLEPDALDPDRLFAGTFAYGAYSARFP